MSPDGAKGRKLVQKSVVWVALRGIEDGGDETRTDERLVLRLGSEVLSSVISGSCICVRAR